MTGNFRSISSCLKSAKGDIRHIEMSSAPQNPQARQYHKIKNYLFFVSLAVDIFVLGGFFFGGYSAALKSRAEGIFSSVYGVNAFYFLIFSVIFYLAHFPLNLFSGFIWEHKFGLSRQKLHQWLWDDLKRSLIGFAVVLFLVEIIYVLLGRFPATWWIGAGAAWVFISVVLARITPNIIIPIFYKYSPIDNGELREKVFALFKSCRVSLNDIYAINFSSKTAKANAFFCGIGRSRRVVLSDTLLKNFSVPEIEAVVAHELAHVRHNDVVRMLCLNSLVIFAGFFLTDMALKNFLAAYGPGRIDDIAFFPVLVLGLIFLSLAAAPLLNAYSRAMEKKADIFSVAKTKNPAAFVSMIQKLGEMNLSEFMPSRLIEVFFYDHPPIGKRIEYVKKLNFQN